MNNDIKKLDKDIISLIAAGEVIESPAAICKELIENSIDSNAKNIILEIKNGGKSYIRVTDDGSGIDETQIVNAFQDHYTSKISTYEDFLNIKSNGFRGEALSSISAISKITIITKTKDKDYAIQAKINQGQMIEYEKKGANQGTTIISKDIFYNTPARKNFLKSDRQEARKITDYMIKYAISHTDISFKYINNDKTIFQTYGSGNLEEVISLIFNREFDNSLITINESLDDDIKISGAIGNNTTMLSSRRGQYLFVNNRIIKSSELTDYIENSYRRYVPSGNFPIFFLNIIVNPRKIDINIHPNKLYVKFSESLNLYNKISEKLEQILKNYQMIPEVRTKEKEVNDVDSDIIKQLEIKLNKNYNNDNTFEFKPMKISEDPILYQNSQDTSIEIDKPLVFDLRKSKISNDAIQEEYVDLTELSFIGRIFNTYIALENENEVYLIDQHAAHERILFERFSKLFTEQKINTQQLLIPKNINLSYEIIDYIDVYLELLSKSGYDANIFGDNIIIIRGIPSIFTEIEAEKYIETITSILSNESLVNDIIYDKIATKACKSAIKGNMFELKNEEIIKLIEDLENCDNRYSCPHGRPIIIKVTKYEIEKLFKRIL